MMTIGSRRSILLSLAVSLAALACEAQNPLGIEDALKVLQFAGRSPISLSPDGEWVSYTVEDNSKRVTYGDERYAYYSPTGAFEEALGCDVWLTNTKTHQSRNLTAGKGASWDPVWSPDGKSLAFFSDRSGVAHLWIWNRGTDQMSQVSEAIVRPFFNFQVPRWTPDGKALVMKTLPEGMTLEQGADLISGPIKKDEAVGKDPNAPTVTVFKFVPDDVTSKATPVDPDANSWMARYETDLTLVDASTGKADHIVRGLRPSGYWFSTDGKYMAYMHIRGMKENTQQMLYQLHVFDLAKRSDRIVVDSIEGDYGISVSWSPNGHTLAYTTAGQLSRGDCFVVTLDGSAPELLTPGDHPPFGDDHRAPLWDAKGENIYLMSSEDYTRRGTSKIWRASMKDRKLSVAAEIPGRTILEIQAPMSGGRFWSPDGGSSMVVGTREEATKREGFYKIDLAMGHAAPLYEANAFFGRDMIFGFDCSADGKTIVFVEQDSQHPEDIYTSDAEMHTPVRASSINERFAGSAFGNSQVISYYSVDGELLHGALLLPGNYEQGKKYPLIVDPYGGSFRSETVFRFGLSGSGVEDLQILATRGYAVLLPDTPIHTNNPMLEIARTVIPAVDRVVEMGIADPNGLGIMGHSYGGYSTLSVIVQTTRFKAAVDSAGPGDLISDYGIMDAKGETFAVGWAETGQGKMGGTPWQYRDRYIENSPIFYLDRVQTPLLIVQGHLDSTVPHQQAEEVFVGLRRLGKEVTYADYGGEDHWEGTWGLANAKDYWNRVIDWFDLHLKAAPPAH